MAGDSPETFGGIRFEAIIVGQTRTLTLRATIRAVNRFIPGFRRPARHYLLPFGTVMMPFSRSHDDSPRTGVLRVRDYEGAGAALW